MSILASGLSSEGPRYSALVEWFLTLRSMNSGLLSIAPANPNAPCCTTVIFVANPFSRATFAMAAGYAPDNAVPFVAITATVPACPSAKRLTAPFAPASTTPTNSTRIPDFAMKEAISSIP